MTKLENVIFNRDHVCYIEQAGESVIIHFVSGASITCKGDEAIYVWKMFDSDDWRSDDFDRRPDR